MKNKDKKTIDFFIKRVDELLSCKLAKTRSKVSFSLNLTNEQGESAVTLPDEDLLRSFLLVFRNLYSPKERINFLKVCKILENNIIDTTVVANIKETRNTYERTLASSPLSFIEEDKKVSPDEMVRRWMYGYYHHTDEEKRERVETWGFAAGLTKLQFVSTVFDLSRCIVWLGSVARDFTKGKIK